MEFKVLSSLKQKFWQRFKRFLVLPPANEFDPHMEISAVLTQGRERIFETMLKYATILATLLVLPVLIYDFQRINMQEWNTLILIDLAAIFSIWLLNFLKNLSFTVRTLLFLSVVYIIAAVELYFFGLAEEWYPFFSAFSLLTTIFLGWRAGLTAVLISVATLAVIAWQISTGAIVITHSNMAVPIPNLADIVILSLAFLLVNSVLVAVIAALLHEFEIAWARERKAAQLVQQERNLLEQKVAERTEQIEKHSEALDQSRRIALAAQKAAETANQAKSVFLANMSHELRTPLNAILGFSHLMALDEGLSAKQQEYVTIVNRSGEHLLTLINDILDITKIEAGRVTVDIQNVDLSDLLNTLENMFQLKAREKGLQLDFQQAPNTPRFIKTDVVKLRQILINLLHNAIKFTAAGKVALRVMATAENKSPGATIRLCFEIEDTGPGISPEELDNLFEAFVQTKAGQSTQEGTGLGLAISRQFVSMLGGELTVTSVPGHGARFRFEIEIEEIEGAMSRPLVRRITGLAPGQPTYRILIADDKWNNRQLLVAMLEPYGFALHEASNGQEALEQWRAWQPHLIFLDIRMPVLDGLEVVRQIKVTPQGQRTVIIVISASSLTWKQQETALIAQCDDFIAKPFREQEIFEKLSQHLGVRYHYDQTQEGFDKMETAAKEAELILQASLSELPSAWIEAMQYAAATVDSELALQLIKQIETDHPGVSKLLINLVNNFQFSKLTELTTIIPAEGKHTNGV